MFRFSNGSTWGSLPFSWFHVEVRGFNFLDSFLMSNEKRMVGLVWVFVFSFQGSACGGQRWIRDSAHSLHLCSSCRRTHHVSANVSESEGLGGEPPARCWRKGRTGPASRQHVIHCQTEASPVWLTQRQCAVTSPLLRPRYLVESATVEEEQPQGTMKYQVERLRQQEVVCKVLKGTASNYWRIRKNLVLWFHNAPRTTVILLLKEQWLL